MPIEMPGPRRAFLFASGGLRSPIGPWAALLVLALGLAGCLDIPKLVRLAWPETVAGVPTTAPWIALPLRSWIARGEVDPVAVAACPAPDCAVRVAVGVFRASGDDAALLASILRDPDRLRRALERQDAADISAERRAIRTRAVTQPITEGNLTGFSIALARQDGSHRAFGGVLARRTSDGLSLVIAIGEDEGAVDRVVREAALANLR